MNNTYRKLMVQQCLSDQAKESIYSKLQKEEVKSQSFLLRVAIVAACIILIVPITAYAVPGNKLFKFRLIREKRGMDQFSLIGLNMIVVPVSQLY